MANVEDPEDAPSVGSAQPGDAGRRRFLKIASGCVGGGLGAALLVPASRLVLGVSGRQTVVSASEPIDAIAADRIGAQPIAVPLRAPSVRDAWSTTRDVPLGVAFVRKDPDGTIRALSSVCPHLGCTVGFDPAANKYLCPCHDGVFALDGAREGGPAKRGLDDLPLVIADGRVKIQWVRYRLGGATKEPA